MVYEREDKISTGSYDLNKWLFGGYEKGIITTLYGDAGTGKTNFCVLAAVSQAKKGKKVIFIDTEGGFSSERVKQICKSLNIDYKKILQNIILLRTPDFKEQKKNILELEKQIKKSNNISLIIIDGMTMLYRLELSESRSDIEQIREINSELAKQLKILAHISMKKEIPILITNQAYSEFLQEEDFLSGKKAEKRMVGGDILKYWSKCIIELQNEKGKRKAVIKKHRSLREKELSFIINDSGIKKRGWI